MKFVMRRRVSEAAECHNKWLVTELTSTGIELLEQLRYYLSGFMQDILDPDIAGRKPDKFIDNMQSGRLGDFTRRYILIASDEKDVVGLLIALPDIEGIFHIYSMGVAIEYRGRGVGSALLSKCIKDAWKSGIEEVILDVHSENIPAINLYRKFQFQ